MALGVFICNKKWALYRINTHFLSLWVLILGIQDTPRFSEPRVGLLQGKVLRFFDPNVRSLAHFLADSVLRIDEARYFIRSRILASIDDRSSRSDH